MEENKVNKDLVEVLQVWYSVFCTIMDDTESSVSYKNDKLKDLRRELRNRLPEIEEIMKKFVQ